MKKVLTLIAIVLLASNSTFAQKYFSRTGHVNFFSDTKMEDIKADNTKATVIVDAASGAVEFSLLIKSFEFEKALMQEHFNENYVESDKFPNAMFKGKVANLNDIDFKTNGEYQVVVEGEMTIHGETKPIQTTGKFQVTDETISGRSVFIVKPEDYKIKIPNTVVQNIAEEIEVTVEVSLKALKK